MAMAQIQISQLLLSQPQPALTLFVNEEITPLQSLLCRRPNWIDGWIPAYTHQSFCLHLMNAVVDGGDGLNVVYICFPNHKTFV